MSLYHQLWGPPDTPDLLRGRELAHKAQDAKTKTARERDYTNAVAIFYRDADPKTQDARAQAYSQSMQKVYGKDPKGHEAAAFYAVSILGTSSGTDLISAKKAIAILKPVLAEEPNHPGIAHYMIHACDSPELAQTGLPAAKQYAAIAASSPHAVHMPSHIFARLGMWQEDIGSNQAAIKATEEQRSRHMHVAHHELHSLDFMEYAYLQLGEDAKAKAVVDGLPKIPRSDLPEDLQDYYNARPLIAAALYTIETRQWKDALALQAPANIAPYNQAHTYWARAIAAGHLRDAIAARAAVDKYKALVEATRKSSKPFIAEYMNGPQDEAEAWALFAEGKNNEALRILRGAADRQDKVGKG